MKYEMNDREQTILFNMVVQLKRKNVSKAFDYFCELGAAISDITIEELSINFFSDVMSAFKEKNPDMH